MTNTSAALVISAKVPGLSIHETQIAAVNIRLRRSGTSYMVHTVSHAGGRVTTRLTGYTSNGTRLTPHCGARSAWRASRGTITVRLPKACLDAGGSASTNFAIGAGNGYSGDPADWTKFVTVGES